MLLFATTGGGFNAAVTLNRKDFGVAEIVARGRRVMRNDPQPGRKCGDSDQKSW
jgi:hypothetical protein